MPVNCVPSQSYFFGPCRGADRLLYLPLQDVKVVCYAPNLREQPSPIIIDLESPALNGDEAVDLIELTQAHKVSLEPRDEVDTGQLTVLASLADKQDGSTPFDLDDGAIAELHRLANPRVELGERRPGPSHMVCCPCVEDPSSVLLLLAYFTDLSEPSLLLQLNWLPSRCPQLKTMLFFTRGNC